MDPLYHEMQNLGCIALVNARRSQQYEEPTASRREAWTAQCFVLQTLQAYRIVGPAPFKPKPEPKPKPHAHPHLSSTTAVDGSRIMAEYRFHTQDDTMQNRAISARNNTE